MTRQWDTQAGRETIEKLRRNERIAREALEKIKLASVYGGLWEVYAERAIAAMDAPLNAESVLGGEPAVDAESVPTPLVPCERMTNMDVPSNEPKCEKCQGKGGSYEYLPDDPTNKLMHGSHWYDCRECGGTGTEKTSFEIGVELLDALRAGDGPERSGRTPTLQELAELDAGE